MKCTVTRALAELKLADKRIAKTLANLPNIIIAAKQDAALTGYDSHADFIEYGFASIQKIDSLLMLRQRIKEAIVLSNASTAVKIGSLAMTVAAAIEMKEFISNKEQLVSQIGAQYFEAVRAVEYHNAKVEEQAHTRAVTAMGENEKDIDKTDKVYRQLLQTFIEKHNHVVIGPPNIRKYIADLTTGIEDFKTNVDIALSESNSTTMLEYDD